MAEWTWSGTWINHKWNIVKLLAPRCAMAVNLFVTPTVLLAFPDFVASGTERSDVVIHDAQLKTNAGLDGLRAKTQKACRRSMLSCKNPGFFGGSFWYCRKIMEMSRSTAWNHICGDIMIYPERTGRDLILWNFAWCPCIYLHMSYMFIWFIRTHRKQNITCGVIRLLSWIERTALRRMMMKRSGQIQMVRTSGNEHVLMQGAGYAHSSMN